VTKAAIFLPYEDADDRTSTVLAAIAQLGGGSRTGDVGHVEGRWILVNLQARLQVACVDGLQTKHGNSGQNQCNKLFHTVTLPMKRPENTAVRDTGLPESLPTTKHGLRQSLTLKARQFK
jgi:hypothetical protein